MLLWLKRQTPINLTRKEFISVYKSKSILDGSLGRKRKGRNLWNVGHQQTSFWARRQMAVEVREGTGFGKFAKSTSFPCHKRLIVCGLSRGNTFCMLCDLLTRGPTRKTAVKSCWEQRKTCHAKNKEKLSREEGLPASCEHMENVSLWSILKHNKLRKVLNIFSLSKWSLKLTKFTYRGEISVKTGAQYRALVSSSLSVFLSQYRGQISELPCRSPSLGQPKGK